MPIFLSESRTVLGPAMYDDRDCYKICHAYLNALHASLQGRYALLNTLSILVDEETYRSDLKATGDLIEQVSYWLEDLWAGAPLVLDAEEQDLGPDAIEAFDLFEQVRRELKHRAVTAQKLICQRSGFDNYHNIALMIGFRAYQAYAKDHYIRGLIAFGETFGPEEITEKWQQSLPGCQQDILRVHEFLVRLCDEDSIDGESICELYEESLLVPAIFRAQIHDLNQIQAFLHDRFTFALADFLPSEWRIWEKYNIQAREAGYWRAYDIPPQEVALWKRSGFNKPETAALWRYRGFEPETAADWSRAGYNSRRAEYYVLLGCEKPDHARAHFE